MNKKKKIASLISKINERRHICDACISILPVIGPLDAACGTDFKFINYWRDMINVTSGDFEYIAKN